ncbi:MAG: class I SAM-dependent methyltransferase [Pseudodesulfovibrio sp.]|uniref:Methyltransferase type 11 n=1 Tax=Pseudodesulfovibrio aespoeensis (strain ATCC 700646 / DSM 10631 / Aspo-2) TaxID=643562 RepID=E6VQZ3_PSEA9|nr:MULTISPECIES: class I SAM-dependent methyltransferase [Pseudodesulfovibrio]MBU4380415.1 class I SAM-dependent methyltransferase [Pseudomonadota bacterium]ADU62973.1 Methyltransferase type 11 [Pseudodesulfovibrio aespoeensis Aspo-2]MBU4475923.1 class I SAM-dependent methyltransferase [Pseudomonadota bacterium]MBU4516761.1 class I SAM-dependent methyltransferase [Pseudomonadota bacterium]MBU4522718.1 class I SAM-dependent methyltransferase [Pseudomonadota bacterium]
MSKYTRPFLDYYQENSISPVSQDISNLQAHFARREALYRHLGIIPSFLRGLTILEFGPGSGHNALYTASLSPKRYVLVDGNPTGLEETRKNLQAAKTDVVVVESLIESFSTDERFDMVMCEGVLPWQKDPESMLRKVAEFVAPGGLLVVSCNNEISALSESLRRLQARLIIDKSLPLLDQAEQLKPVFRQDLESLNGMSRPHQDWILDQILQPFIGRCLTLENTIAALDDDYNTYCTSPHFLLDWAWYKEVPLRRMPANEFAISTIRRNNHNFLDYRVQLDPREEEGNILLDTLARQITEDGLLFETTGETTYLKSVRAKLSELVVQARTFSPVTAESLDNFCQGLGAWLDTGSFPELTAFKPLFGRGQQYISLIRKDR